MLICVLDHAKGVLSSKLVAVASQRFFVATELGAMALVLVLSNGHHAEAVSIWGILIVLTSDVFVFLFVGDRKAKKNK